MQRVLFALAAVSSTLVLVGCEPPPIRPIESTEPDSVQSPAQPPARPDTGADGESTRLKPEESGDSSSTGARDPSEERSSREVARVGAGRKGRTYGGGPISEPARLHFRLRERVVFDVQIPQAQKTYKALDPEGKGPKTHKEFMDKIINENGIRLPELPEGETYEYDPQTEELMVVRNSR